MTAARDDDTFAEWLLNVPRTVLRWAGPPKSRAGGPGSPLGSLNPLTLLRIVVVLVLVALMPLFMLPLLLVRLATHVLARVRP